MSRPPYPHRCLGGDPFVWACRCKATPDIYSAETARDGWDSGCRVAMEVRIAEAEAERDAARKMLAECYRLSGADPDGDGWEHLWQTAVDEVRELRQQHDEMRRESRADTDKAVAAALEAKAKELDAKADAALAAADKAEEAGDEEREDAESARWTAYRVAARIVRGAP